jgi:hypothetical protein
VPKARQTTATAAANIAIPQSVGAIGRIISSVAIGGISMNTGRLTATPKITVQNRRLSGARTKNRRPRLEDILVLTLLIAPLHYIERGREIDQEERTALDIRKKMIESSHQNLRYHDCEFRSKKVSAS